MKNSLYESAYEKKAKIQTEENRKIYRINDGSGELTITEYGIFSGIRLYDQTAYDRKYVYPPVCSKGLLEITHCREGRLEYEAEDSVFYLTAGDMSISKSSGEGTAIYCPTQYYHGISVVIDPVAAPNCLSCLLEDVKVRPAALMEKFCEKERYFLMRSNVRLEHVFSEFYSVAEDIQKEICLGYFKVKILELLLFLSSITPELSQIRQRSCSKAQTVLAKQVCEFINMHMDTRLTISQLAEEFYVSPSQLKNCFYNVYGESIQSYIRGYKMRSAANCQQPHKKSRDK
ncbi:AraC family transcriptional regulator [bacterium]|nr:AraC family transcriptional regulator [bacterium]MDY3022015.1 AraC family transcriptional regulator [Oliverpabstia sp.]